jgi:DNA polymerase-3 subunit beta
VKFSCNGSDLGKALRIACAVAPPRNQHAALSCVRLDAAGTKLAITATNLDIQVTVQIDVAITEEGSTLVNANVARGLARAGHAAFETDGTDLVFRGASSSARLQTMQVQDFPILASEGDFKPINSPLSDILDCMKFAADEEVRYFLRGVCVAPDHCVATDGHRLIAIEGGGGENQIIPKDAAAILATMPDATVQLSDRMWMAKTDTVTAYGKLIDAQFPDWSRIMPQLSPTMDVQADELADAASALTPVFSEKVRKISIKEQDGAILLSANGNFGTADAHAPASGKLDEVGINGKYLESVCAAFSGASVGMAAGKDILLFAAGNRRAVIMGMR